MAVSRNSHNIFWSTMVVTEIVEPLGKCQWLIILFFPFRFVLFPSSNLLKTTLYVLHKQNATFRHTENHVHRHTVAYTDKLTHSQTVTDTRRHWEAAIHRFCCFVYIQDNFLFSLSHFLLTRSLLVFLSISTLSHWVELYVFHQAKSSGILFRKLKTTFYSIYSHRRQQCQRQTSSCLLFFFI